MADNVEAYQFISDTLAQINAADGFATDAGANIKNDWFGYAVSAEDAAFPMLVVEPGRDVAVREAGSDAKRAHTFNVIGVEKAELGPLPLMRLAHDMKKAIGRQTKRPGLLTVKVAQIEYVASENESSLSWFVASVEISAVDKYQ